MVESAKPLLAALLGGTSVGPWATVVTILDELLEEVIPAGEIMPTWSPFGFLITDLTPADSEALLRLHIWPRAHRRFQEPDWPIHFHCWTLKSWVLVGEVVNEVFVVEPDPDRGDHQTYSASYEQGVSTLKATAARVSCNRISRTTLAPGEDYTVPQGQYHRTHVDYGRLAATIVLMTNRVSAAPLAIGSWMGEPQYHFDRRLSTMSEATGLLATLRAFLG